MMYTNGGYQKPGLGLNLFVSSQSINYSYQTQEELRFPLLKNQTLENHKPLLLLLFYMALFLVFETS
jgi:hypothetical protein